MNVFNFTGKHIAARIMAVMTLFALFTSLIPSQAFANHDVGGPYAGQVLGKKKDAAATIEKIKICHSTGSLTNPYTNPEVNIESFFSSGHDKDLSDIIPPFHYTLNGTTVLSFGGTNWNTGKATWENGCVAPTPPPVDLCSNIPNAQATIPVGYYADGAQCFPNPVPCPQGTIGTFMPDCVTPPPPVPCPDGYTGTFMPDCTPIPPPPVPCPQGTTGDFEPNCTVIPPPPTCTDGIMNGNETGIDTGGECAPPPVPCPQGTTGDFEPNCTVIPPPPVPCPDGYTGTFMPDCTPIPPPPVPCPQGTIGTFMPDCVTPPPPTCVDGIMNGNETGVDTGGECPDVPPPPQTCTVEIVSNTNSYVVEKGANALALSFVHPEWNASIPGATWIWGDNPVANPTTTATQTFRNQFGFAGTVTSATLYVASDNTHVTTLNSDSAGSSTADNNFKIGTQKQYNVTSLIDQGNNELNIAVTNIGVPNSDAAGNPAGVLYKLVINGTVTDDVDCSVPYVPPVDMCLNVGGFQSEVPEDLVRDEGGNCNEPVPPVCEIGNNLLANPSFELPVIGSDWAISSITDWIITNDANTVIQDGEIWRGYVAPSDGLQNVELGAYERTMITQTVNTVVGATYEFRFDFAARGTDASDNNVNALVDGNIVMNVNSGNTAWKTSSTTFVATDTTTDISLRDIGTQNSTGSLVDNTVLCLVSEPEVVPPPRTFKIFGYVWHDDNENEDWDNRFPEEQNQEEQVVEEEGEEPLAGRIITISNDEYSTTTTTDVDGYYEFNVPAGTWIITETLPEGWEHTWNESYEVTVPQVPVIETTFLDAVREFFIPTAHAQFIAIPVPTEYGEYNFGNDETPGPSGGGGGGSLLPPSSRTPAVRGDRTDGKPVPQPQVLGEQVSLVPVGAPDAGGGGTSPFSIQLPTLVAAFLGRRRFDV